MNKDKVLNPDPREVRNYGWKNLKIANIKDKHALSVEEEHEVIAKANEMGDEEFAHAFAWLVDVGMRYETEFLSFTFKDINWKKQTICFFRGKTNEWSVNIPLTERAFSIAKQYKDVALTRQSQKLFSLGLAPHYHQYPHVYEIPMQLNASLPHYHTETCKHPMRIYFLLP